MSQDVAPLVYDLFAAGLDTHEIALRTGIREGRVADLLYEGRLAASGKLAASASGDKSASGYSFGAIARRIRAAFLEGTP